MSIALESVLEHLPGQACCYYCLKRRMCACAPTILHHGNALLSNRIVPSCRTFILLPLSIFHPFAHLLGLRLGGDALIFTVAVHVWIAGSFSYLKDNP